MGAMASQITSLTIVYSTVYSGADHRRKHQSSASLAFVRGIHRWPGNSSHKWPLTRKMFPFDDVIMVCWKGFVSIWTIFNILRPISMTAVSNAFSPNKLFAHWFKFHKKLVPRSPVHNTQFLGVYIRHPASMCQRVYEIILRWINKIIKQFILWGCRNKGLYFIWIPWWRHQMETFSRYWRHRAHYDVIVMLTIVFIHIQNIHEACPVIHLWVDIDIAILTVCSVDLLLLCMV